MVTEISPIFGLSLLGIMDILMIIAGFGSFGVALVIWHTHKRQKKIDSARLLIDLRNQLKVEPFVEVLNKIHDGKSSECDQKSLQRYLGHMEMVAGFYKDRLLNKRDSELFAPQFSNIEKDTYIQTFMDEIGRDQFPSIDSFHQSY